MKKIYKFVLDQRHETVSMPTGATILSCKEQDGKVCLWAIVDVNNPPEDRKFEILGTGWEIVDESTRNFIGTIVDLNGSSSHNAVIRIISNGQRSAHITPHISISEPMGRTLLIGSFC